MAVTRIGAGDGAMTTGTAATFNGPDVDTSDANTVAIVGVSISVSSNSTSTTCAVTYGGVSMTQLSLTLAGSTTSRNATGIYYLFDPGTGVQSVVVTPGGSSTKAGLVTQASVFSGVKAAGVGTAQTAAATTHAPTSIAFGYDIRVLTNGAALTSPNQTQEYLNGQSVGGVGDYGVMQSAAGTGSTISFTCTGTATTPNSVATSLTPQPILASSLKDNFDTLDSAKWTYTTGTSIVSQQLNIVADTNFWSGTSKEKIDLTGSSVIVQIPSAANAGASPGITVLHLGLDATNMLRMEISGGFISGYNKVANVTVINNAVAYNATNHKWVRIRESGGTAFWDYSKDAVSWTNLGSGSPGFAVTSLSVQLYVGASSGSYVGVFDSLNLPPITAIRNQLSAAVQRAAFR